MSSVGMQIRSVEVDGQILRVGIRSGSGVTPPLLIFNGIGANLELVEPFVAALEGVETVIFDVPGIGGSPLPPDLTDSRTSPIWLLPFLQSSAIRDKSTPSAFPGAELLPKSSRTFTRIAAAD